MTKHTFERNGITSTVYLQDCMKFMAGCRDKQFELAIVDPPYDFSIGNKTNFYVSQGKYNKVQETRPKGGFKIGGNYMDSIQKAPNEEYFKELFRVSKNQIVWGGNYFTKYLEPSTCWITWDKMNGESYFGDCELAWTSFGSAIRKVKKVVHEKGRIHPTQKPVYLYKWLLHNYAKAGDTILDTHLGSQSSRIAAFEMGFNFVGCELDADYFRDGNKRFDNHVKQLKLC
jgi:site-specific DNA-methyltransferase (adenine-specific)